MARSRKSIEAEEETLTPFFEWQDAYPWQHAALQARLQQRASWPQALLIHGAAGIGKRVLALNAARALLCEGAEKKHGEACGVCESCHYVAMGQHPDLMLIEPLERDPSGEVKVLDTIPVDAIRRLIDFMQVTSHRQRAKVAVIVPAEQMNAAAANALLKTLEEPPVGSALMLVAQQWQRLPATVLSRCQRWAAPYPSTGEALAFLREEGIDGAEQLLAQTGGAPLTARDRFDPEQQTWRQDWQKALAQPHRLSPYAVAQAWAGGNRDDNKQRLAQFVEALIGWTVDLARIHGGGAARYHVECQKMLQPLAAAVAPSALFHYHRSLLRQRRWLSHPLQPRLVVEALLIEYRALFTHRRPQ
ncbi:MAG: DNA polymerase III subunit delta' [Proteobacteria bacterium]|nr:DNA polymerase III subunit delta' [Pseudomonadota bacterium]MCL2306964.1 DNA polymerase III subunit delta' [Pseudomonadota bacterium]